MFEEESGAPRVLPSPYLLDDIELIRQGVEIPVTSMGQEAVVSVPSGVELVKVDDVVLIEPEGVPMAIVPVRLVADTTNAYALDGPLRFVAPRPDRPFESLHAAVDTLPPSAITVALDHAVEADHLAEHLPAGATVLLLAVAAVERDGETEPQDIAVCRHVRHLCQELSAERFGLERVDLAIVPIAQDHPRRQDRIEACLTAYSRGGVVADLTRAVDESPTDPGTGAVLLFTGLSGSGKSTLAKALRNILLESTDRTVTLLDGDVVRRQLSSGLGFSPLDRDTNIRRIGWVAARIAEHGGLAICSPIAPFEATRQAVREMTTRAGARFVLVHVATPLQECERRDRKGLYARARRGEIPDFTGISSAYEEPVDPDLRLDTTGQEIEPLVRHIVDFGIVHGLWSAAKGL